MKGGAQGRQGARGPGRARALMRSCALALAACNSAPVADGSLERVVIPRGATFSAVTDSLAAHGLIGSRRWFRLRARISGLDRTAHAGTYEFRRGTPAAEILLALREGRVVLERVTIPEGLTIPEIARLVDSVLDVPADSFVVAAADTVLLRAAGIGAATAEGYLFPETYHVESGVTGRELVRQMLAGFEETWDTSWTVELQRTGRSQEEAVILASIVEGEARTDEERPVIAGVYSNRLRIGMPLQADPTIQYAIQLATGNRKPRLYERDYGFPSPYNTYLHPGYPPGPINNPGRGSLEAAVYPADVPFLYFVARPDGTHIFSRTYAEHLRAVRSR